LSYVDPGAGSMLVQLVIASCLGAITMWRQRIFAVFRRGKDSIDRPEAASPSKSAPNSSDAKRS